LPAQKEDHQVQDEVGHQVQNEEGLQVLNVVVHQVDSFQVHPEGGIHLALQVDNYFADEVDILNLVDNYSDLGDTDSQEDHCIRAHYRHNCCYIHQVLMAGLHNLYQDHCNQDHPLCTVVHILVWGHHFHCNCSLVHSLMEAHREDLLEDHWVARWDEQQPYPVEVPVLEEVRDSVDSD